MVVSKDGGQAQRFLAVDVYQMSLVEPETKRLGWGVVKFAGLLQVREKLCVHVSVDVRLCLRLKSLKALISFLFFYFLVILLSCTFLPCTCFFTFCFHYIRSALFLTLYVAYLQPTLLFFSDFVCLCPTVFLFLYL